MKLTKKAISILGVQAATIEAVPRSTIRAEGERLARESGVTDDWDVREYGSAYADGFEKRQRELQRNADIVARERARIAQVDAMMQGKGSAHSRKAAETLQLMGTVPSDWKRVGIRWTVEDVTMNIPVRCPGCKGRGIRVDRFDYAACGHAGCTGSYRVLAHRVTNGGDTVSAVVKSERKVFVVMTSMTFRMEVGRPDFAPGYRLASRFGGAANCNLCNKLIRSGEFCFVEAQLKDGRVLAMAVGCDCARTFLGVKKVEPLEIGQKLVMNG